MDTDPRWQNPCPHDAQGAHNFMFIPEFYTVRRGDTLVIALCIACGAAR